MKLIRHILWCCCNCWLIRCKGSKGQWGYEYLYNNGPTYIFGFYFFYIMFCETTAQEIIDGYNEKQEEKEEDAQESEDQEESTQVQDSP